MPAIQELTERAGALLGRIDAARADRPWHEPPRAALRAGSAAMQAVVAAGLAITERPGYKDLSHLTSLLAHLGKSLHQAESCDMPEAELLAFAQEVQQLAEAVRDSVTSLPRGGSTADV
jgi:hypothetical protein